MRMYGFIAALHLEYARSVVLLLDYMLCIYIVFLVFLCDSLIGICSMLL